MRVVYFAWVREQIGLEAEDVATDGLLTIDDLVGALTKRGGGYAEALGDKARLRAAVDQVMTGFDASIEGASEVAFFPPVTGG